MDKAAHARLTRNAKNRAIVDRRRFKESPVPKGTNKGAVPRSATGTRYKNTLAVPDGTELMFKRGVENVKIGGDVLVGDLAGAYIVTLSFEERATCPRSCGHWTTCYGNGMQQARRWSYSPDVHKYLESELDDLCATYPGVLVRLHVLGDFMSKGYVNFWGAMLRKHRNLFCFGFTAHKPGTALGNQIAALRSHHRGPYKILSRFAIRHSGTSGTWGSFTIDFPTRRAKLGDAVVCPEQRSAMDGVKTDKHCGSCALCWQSDVPITFVEH